MKILKHISYLACAAATAASFSRAPAKAQSEPLIGQMMHFGGNFCLRSWAEANGQLLAISSNTALFSFLGTMYSGDGRSTFALPDLRGRAVIGVGNRPGLTSIRQGQLGGSETFTLNSTHLPSHSHAVNATNKIANKNGPGTDFLAIPNLEHDIYHEGPPNKVMDPDKLLNTGLASPSPVLKTSPSLGMNWCISLQGVYPSRS